MGLRDDYVDGAQKVFSAVNPNVTYELWGDGGASMQFGTCTALVGDVGKE